MAINWSVVRLHEVYLAILNDDSPIIKAMRNVEDHIFIQHYICWWPSITKHSDKQGRVTGKYRITSSRPLGTNFNSSDRHQANAGILLIEPLRTNFSEIRIKIQSPSFMKMHLKMSSGKWRPFCPGGDELICIEIQLHLIKMHFKQLSVNLSWPQCAFVVLRLLDVDF